MSDLLQSGHYPDPGHPDLDQLSAFAEQSLPPHEYQETLAHLATCPHCRTIVALSLPTVEEVSSPALSAFKTRWFSGWSLAWPAAAAFAGLTFVVLYVQHAQLATSHLSQQSQVAVLREEAKPQAPPLEPSQSVVSRQALKPAAPNPPNPRPNPSPSPMGSRAITIPMTGRNELGFPELARSGQPTAVGGALPAPQANASAAFRTPAEAKVLSPSVIPAPPRASTTTVAVQASNQSIETANAVMNAPLLSSTGAQVALQPAHPLPSGHPTLSMTSEGHRVLAIDAQNALFLSEDDGQHWQPIPAQWSGRAVKVNLAISRPAHAFMAAKSASGLTDSHPSSVGKTLALPTPAITGVVTDLAGAVIPGATVLISNTQTQQTTTLKTDATGRYLAPGLAPGTYQLEADCLGFQKRLLSSLTLAPNQTLQADLTLEIGASTETVTVTADEVQVEAEPAKKKSDAKALRAIKAAPAMPLPPVFEIFTDNGARWTSPDGQHWQPQTAQK
jgi:hypothetical protein